MAQTEMKQSGISWFGNIPEGWSVKRIKYVIQNSSEGIKVGPFGSALTDEVVGNEDGEFKIYGQANLIRNDFDYGDNFVTRQSYMKLKNYEVLPKDVLVSMMGTIGKCCVVPDSITAGIMDSHLIKIRLADFMFPKYFEYLYESSVVYEQLLQNSKGSIMNGLNSTIVKNIYFLKFDKVEQKAIANFLDSKCAEIDSIISDIEKQIDIAQRYKKALITETVTKGLDKSVPMKPSGIQWIGDIPSHWEYKKIRYATEVRNSVAFLMEGIPYIGLENIESYTGKFIETETEYDEGKYSSFFAGDVMFNKLRPYLAKVFMPNFDGVCTGELTVFKSFKGYKRYLYYYLLSDGFLEIVNASTYGAKMPRASWEYIKNLPIFLPSINEQHAIADFLDMQCEKLNRIIDKKQVQLYTMQNYKKSLIYEYVTGKKRVTC